MVKKLNGESLDLTKQNIERLKELFPEVISDGHKIDFNRLKAILGESVEDQHDRYQFTWHGKKQTIVGAQKPSKGTLRPLPEKSKNFDTTENLYIEGDNLEVLKLLQKSYNGKIKMIYIDPPYNTGKDFVYKDNFVDGVQNYLELTGQLDSEGNILSTNTERNGRFHTDWLNMMYSRLKLARNLLTEDGVIFISIDDHEQSRLKFICDEIFGESNFVSNFIWYGGRKNDSKLISNSHEYILIYVKNSNYLTENKILWREQKQGLDKIYVAAKEFYETYGEEEGSKRLKQWFQRLSPDDPALANKHYANVDEHGPYYKDNISWPGGGGPVYDVIHPITKKLVKIPSRGWLFKEERMLELIADGRVAFGPDENGVPTYKRYLKETETQVPLSVLYNDNRGAMKRLRDLFEGKTYFDFPKDEKVIQKLIKIIPMNENDIVLDFFSGSATTAQAVMQANAEDGLNRKFILVQLPEQLDENSVAFKDGYETICDIGEERIRRAGDLIKHELVEMQKAGRNVIEPESLDIGFKVLKLDTSNIREWNTDFENIEKTLDLFETPFIDGRTEMDIVFEILIKFGLKLTVPINTFNVDERNVYDVAHGNLFICLAAKIDTNIAKAIIEKRDEYENETSSVVLSDAGFGGNDSEKLNCIELLKEAGYPEDNLLTI
ncbi:site-specific DNA-methyltransferase [Ureibacillus acetophenoni]|uniref:Adenine-specific DNA-methyltransferase n=1 Tax=Ureibacillus acetophenoni TaxID=614649 RepID=A0A285URF8_9BACL|nr:site-specific DNA-methyltransferase [Ureibacillus acetophenoni]SOC44454.1 adenine-specific DNA-methyltransferase [Ureibacillus acetophenoni]